MGLYHTPRLMNAWGQTSSRPQARSALHPGKSVRQPVQRKSTTFSGEVRSKGKGRDMYPTSKLQSLVVFTPSTGVPSLSSRPAMYRAYMRHLRLIPDPHLWTIMQPTMRELCAQKFRVPDEVTQQELENASSGEESFEEERARKKSLQDAKSMLNDLRAAVACHPHALERLLEEVYALRGALRYTIIQNIERSSEPSADPRKNEHLLGPNRPSLPPPLAPLVHPSPPEVDPLKGARPNGHVPPRAGARKARQQWQLEWKKSPVPLILPQGTGATTGFEKKGIIESLRILAGVGETHLSLVQQPNPPKRAHPDNLASAPVRHVFNNPAELPSYNLLSPVMKRIFPKKLRPTLREIPYPKPASHQTRTNSKMWWNPVPLNPRLLQRCYENIWEKLVWVRPNRKEGTEKGWAKCSYDDMKRWEAGVAEEDLNSANSAPKRKRSAKKQGAGQENADDQYNWCWASHNEAARMQKARVDRLIQAGKGGTWAE